MTTEGHWWPRNFRGYHFFSGISKAIFKTLEFHQIFLVVFVGGVTCTSLQHLFTSIPFVILLTTKPRNHHYFYFSDLASWKNSFNSEFMRSFGFNFYIKCWKLNKIIIWALVSLCKMKVKKVSEWLASTAFVCKWLNVRKFSWFMVSIFFSQNIILWDWKS